jgi:uncharacterized protein YbjT (DUF2867 family)
MSKVALIAGATGLVGSALLDLLLKSDYYTKVISLQRTQSTVVHPKLVTIQTDFSNLNEIIIPNVSDAFCCLGTTIKKAGSKEQFIKVDFDFPLALAHLAIKANAKHFLIITAMGADEKSFFFYNQVKGKIENALTNLKEISQISIFRPSLLIGNRKEKRIGEIIGTGFAKIINPLMVGSLRKYQGIESVDVANAMYFQALYSIESGVRIYPSDEIKNIAASVKII